MRSNWTPAAGNVIAKLSLFDFNWLFVAIKASEEAISVAFKVRAMGINGIKGIMVPPFTEFSFVVNHAIVAFNFACREIALEILSIIGGIPQTPFHLSEKRESFGFFALVFDFDFLNLASFL